MFTSLDLLIIVAMVLAAAALLSLCLMFLLKKRLGKRICLYAVSGLALFVSYIALHIGMTGWFAGQILFGALTLLAAIGAIVLDIVGKNSDKLQKISRFLAAGALLVGFANALLI